MHHPTSRIVAPPDASTEICDAPQHARIRPFMDLVLASLQVTAHATAYLRVSLGQHSWKEEQYV